MSEMQYEKSLKVGIVGAGCAGLFAGLIFDHLNEQIDDLNISYEILEAAPKSRIGGRLHTYRFSEDTYDYFDAGAMRFPTNTPESKTSRLFNFLELSDRLEPYYLADQLNICPKSFNNHARRGKIAQRDPYAMNARVDPQGRIPDRLLSQGPAKVFDSAVHRFKEIVALYLDPKTDSNTISDADKKRLIQADALSIREYLCSIQHPEGPFNDATIDWIETMTGSKGEFVHSLLEILVEQHRFEMPKNWACLRGGAQLVAVEMEKKLSSKPLFDHRVSAVAVDNNRVELKLEDPRGQQIEREYAVVFNATTLGALQHMDLDHSGMRQKTKQAIQDLTYAPCCKVAIKFKKSWWRLPPFNITKGGSALTDLPIRLCVYPSYGLEEDPERPAVLLCSYTFLNDAIKMRALIAKGETYMKTLLLQNLAALHATDQPHDVVLKMLQEVYVSHHAFDWSADPYASGSEAFFMPGQYSKLWPEIIEPNGNIYLVGEASSVYHGWVEGALGSVSHALWHFFGRMHREHPSIAAYGKAVGLLTADDGILPFGPVPFEFSRFIEVFKNAS